MLTLSAGCSGGDSTTFGSGSAGTGTAGTTGSSAGGAGSTGTGGTTGTEATSTGTEGTSTGTEATSTGTGTGGASGGLQAGDLVVTEIMNNPGEVNDDAGEWIEIHNTTGQPIDLAGLVLDSGAASHTIASSVKIAPSGYAVLGANANAATNGGVPVDYQYAMIKLMNTKGDITIRTAGKLVIDTTSYDEASGLDPDGRSRTLDPKFLSAAMNDTDLHWCSGTSFVAGNSGDRATPGKANDACP
ncbi:MAG: lamin tail domain-containing protein [Byssovorax sp.]